MAAYNTIVKFHVERAFAKGASEAVVIESANGLIAELERQDATQKAFEMRFRVEEFNEQIEEALAVIRPQAEAGNEAAAHVLNCYCYMRRGTSVAALAEAAKYVTEQAAKLRS